MKKCFYALMVMLMALVSIGLISCGDDDDPKFVDIVGTWAHDSDIIGDFAVFFQFTKDGKFHHVTEYINEVVGAPQHVCFDGTYYIKKGNLLTIIYKPNPLLSNDGDTIECVYSIVGDKLKLLSGGEPLVFTRVDDSVIQPYL